MTIKHVLRSRKLKWFLAFFFFVNVIKITTAFHDKQTTRNSYCLAHGVDLTKPLENISAEAIKSGISAHQRRLLWFSGKGNYAFSAEEQPPGDAALLVLKGYDLRGIDFSNSDLRGADFSCSDLRGSIFTGSRLGRALTAIHEPVPANKTRHATADSAWFSGADLRGANFENADMNGVFAQYSYIGVTGLPPNIHDVISDPNWDYRDDGCDERDSPLDIPRGIRWTKMKGASLNDADFAYANFNPDVDSLPSATAFSTVGGLATLRHCGDPTALILLREELKHLGVKQPARLITLAIRSQENSFSWDNPLAVVPYLLFDATCRWGFDNTRPLVLLFLAVLVFTIPYRIALNASSSGRIWLVYPNDRVERFGEVLSPQRLVHRRTAHVDDDTILATTTRPWLSAIALSIASTFAIGWHDLNIGTWLARISGRESVLRTTGWTRSLTGLQSVLGVYLLALWVLTYFGSPFDY